MTDQNLPSLSVAIIGMACRFPGAVNVNQFWHNLRNGVDSITHFSEEEMHSFGISPDRYRSPEFVRASPVLADADCFDADFFGFAPKEAALMDPQHRVFLECAWEALESSGYKPDQTPQPVGVFAGTSLSSYLLYNILPNLNDPHAEDSLQAMIGNDKDFLATRVSYKLNLRGPSIDVQTGCSTSLVAVHLACQSLLSYQCDIALAGGVSVQTPQRRGYLFQPGGLCSPDGRCRAFDAGAEGTLFGSGVGIVVLKRLEDAITDGDHIVAIIRGSAVNNDGSGKLGYTAPSVVGQAEVIRAAHAVAQVEARSISYVECHGTATPLGDPAEVTALTNAFRASTSDTGFCAIGSVKTNIGHLDAAAGIAGLIKTALALENAELPPSLHFVTANPQIDFASTPFFVNSALRQWNPESAPRRAGVSSFGIGGTNAHLILEAANKPESARSNRSRHILCLSAKTPLALDAASTRLADFIMGSSNLSPADVAYTLQTGRSGLCHRRAVVCNELTEAAHALRCEPETWNFTQQAFDPPRDVVFLFPGGGSQHVNMGAGLYTTEPVFRQHLDHCAEILAPLLNCDVRSHLYPVAPSPEAAELMQGTEIGLPALFAVEYALGRLWMEWGMRPTAMIGHSLGEYTAACLAGVLSLEDALGIVAVRGRLMSQLPTGAMLSVPLSVEEVGPYLGEALSIAAVNGPSQTVVSGPAQAIKDLEKTLEEKEIESRRIRIAVASHSPLVESILPEFLSFVSNLRTNSPQIPYISNLTGGWITEELIKDPLYWVKHLRSTVNFLGGMEELLRKPDCIFLEVGPGNALNTLAQGLSSKECTVIAIPSMRHPYDQETDETFVHKTAARLWAYGVVNDWSKLYGEEAPKRVPLPTYPFEKRRHWISSQTVERRAQNLLLSRTSDTNSWVYSIGWQSAPPLSEKKSSQVAKWLVLASDHPSCVPLIEQLRQSGHEVFVVTDNSEGNGIPSDLQIDPQNPDTYSKLWAKISEWLPARVSVLHMWNLSSNFDSLGDVGRFEHVSTYGVLSLSYLTTVFLRSGLGSQFDITVVADRVFRVEDVDVPSLEKSLLVGTCRVIPQENPSIRCRLIDIGSLMCHHHSQVSARLWAELSAAECVPVVALRGASRWIPHYPSITLPEPDSPAVLREAGVYMIWGGTGEVGLEIAKALYERSNARLAIVSRGALPPLSEWEQILESESESILSAQVRTLKDLLDRGARILVLKGDIASEESVRQATRSVLDEFGELHGVFNLAGSTGESVVHLAADSDREQIRAIVEPKLCGTRNLVRALGDYNLDFVLQFSSTAGALGGVGLSSYASSNIAIEVSTTTQLSSSRTRWMSIAWDAWLTPRYSAPKGMSLPRTLEEYAVTPADAIEALILLLDSGVEGSFVVSAGNMDARYRRGIESNPSANQAQANPGDTLTANESAVSPARQYEAPGNELEETITRVWQEHLGVARIGRYDRFFELGGNSLLALRIVSDLKKALKMDIQVVSVFEGVSVHGLGQILATHRDNGSQLDAGRERGAIRRHQHQATKDDGVLAT